MWAVERYQPAYLVLHDGVFPALEEGDVARDCTMIKQFSREETGYNQDMTVYHCQYP